MQNIAKTRNNPGLHQKLGHTCPAGLFKHDNYITGYVEIERLKGVPYLYKTDKGWSADIPFLKHDLFNQWTLR